VSQFAEAAAAMAQTVRSLALGDALPTAQRQALQARLRGCRTGANRIRAGVPAGWEVGDKTGTGDYGTTNDVAVLWPPSRKPIVLAIYYTQRRADEKAREDVIAAAARIVVNSWSTRGRLVVDSLDRGSPHAFRRRPGS
jgi:beta-lactamase class A